MSLLALDIGGVNLKAADGRGYAAVRPFALWREPARLADELQSLIAAAPPADRLVATMTGELCDCFETKATGVRAIVDALERSGDQRPIAVYLTDGRLATPDEARESPLLAAASNWHALASFVMRLTQSRPGVLIDVGSTTADVIPLDRNGPAATGRTDPERLLAGELAYTGVERTPIAAVVSHLPWRGGYCPVASELFATTADAYVLLGDLPEEPKNLDTADGRPRTVAAAHARLARMICADATMFSADDAQRAAAAIRDRQLSALEAALAQVVTRIPAPIEVILVSGHGEFLARRLVKHFDFGGTVPELVWLSKVLGPEVSRAAPAHALAVLASEMSADWASNSAPSESRRAWLAG